MKNSTRSWILLSILSLSFIVLGNLLAGREGLLWGLACALCTNTLVYFYSDLQLPTIYKARILQGQDSWGILSTVSKFAKKCRIPSPAVYIYHSPTPQSFCFGRNLKSAKILLSDSLIETLSSKELDTVLAYHLICIRNLDSLAFTIASTIAKGIMFLPQQLDKIIALALGPKWEFQKSGQITAWLFAPIAAFIIKLCIQQKSLNLNDLAAAELCDSSQDLAKAIWKVHSYRKTKPQNISAALSHLFIVNPLIGKCWTKYFNLQSNTEDRIKNLIGYFPL